MSDRVFVTVTLTFTEKEYLKLRRDAVFLASGQARESARISMNLSGEPYRYTTNPTVLSEREYQRLKEQK